MNERNPRNLLYKRLRAVKDNMMARCYNPNNPKYKSYGALGVQVMDKWHKLSGFIDDVDRIDGWDEEMFLKGELRLDKDKKDINNKLYSLETCTWITQAENSKYKPNAQREMVGINPNGEEVQFRNMSEFAKRYDLDRITIYDCLTKKINQHKGRQFYYKGEERPEPRTIYRATKEGINGEIVEAYSQSELADKLGIPRNKVYTALRKGRNNVYNGYTFTRE